MALAKIEWILTPKGRGQPPSGPKYVTVVRFEHDESFPKTAWSLCVEWPKPGEQLGEGVYRVSFLMPTAPNSLIAAGKRFELYEGFNLAAQGTILAE